MDQCAGLRIVNAALVTEPGVSQQRALVRCTSHEIGPGVRFLA